LIKKIISNYYIKMNNIMHIDDNIFLFEKRRNEIVDNFYLYNVYIYITINNVTTIERLISCDFMLSNIHLYFDNHVSLTIRRINNQVSEYQLFMNVITYQNFIKREFINSYIDNENDVFNSIFSIITSKKNENNFQVNNAQMTNYN